MEKLKIKFRIKSIFWITILLIIFQFWWIVAIVEKLVSKSGSSYYYIIKKDYRRLVIEIKETYYSIKTGVR